MSDQLGYVARPPPPAKTGDHRGSPARASWVRNLDERHIDAIGRRPTHHSSNDHSLLSHARRRRSSRRLNGPSRTCSPNTQRRRVSFSTVASVGALPIRSSLFHFFLNARTFRVDSETRLANFLSCSAALVRAS